MAVTTKPPANTIQSQYPDLRIASSNVDWQDVNGQVLKDLENLGQEFKDTLTITSGYRTPAQSVALGESPTDPHTQGIAADVTIGGKPIADVIPVSFITAAGLESGDQAGFDPTKAGGYDPVHVQLSASNQSSPTPSGGGTTALGFFDAVLNKIGAPITTTNERLLEAWANAEGTSAQNNPLATTIGEPGSSTLSGNTAGVQNYTTAASGETATAATLEGSGFSVILQDLKQNYAVGVTDTPSAWEELNYWATGTHGNDTATQYVKNIQSDFGAEKSAYSGFGFGNFPADGGLTGALSAPGKLVADAFSSWTGWLGELGPYVLRGGEMLAGGVLVLLGIIMLGKGAANSAPTTQVRGAARTAYGKSAAA